MRRSEAGTNLKATVPRSSVPWARRPLSAPGLTTLTLVADRTSAMTLPAHGSPVHSHNVLALWW